jgi:hypothetical protein
MLSTNPPWPLAVAFLVLLGWPMMGVAYLTGHSDAIRWASRMTDELIERRKRELED